VPTALVEVAGAYGRMGAGAFPRLQDPRHVSPATRRRTEPLRRAGPAGAVLLWVLPERRDKLLDHGKVRVRFDL
jgi:hypothetical protein